MTDLRVAIELCYARLKRDRRLLEMFGDDLAAKSVTRLEDRDSRFFGASGLKLIGGKQSARTTTDDRNAPHADEVPSHTACSILFRTLPSKTKSARWIRVV